jgi:hypothetical protein
LRRRRNRVAEIASRLPAYPLHIGSFEVTVRAMLGGKPSPRQLTSFEFAIRWGGSQGSFSRVTILPDSAIEVFDDRAQIGKYANATLRVVARP